MAAWPDWPANELPPPRAVRAAADCLAPFAAYTLADLMARFEADGIVASIGNLQGAAAAIVQSRRFVPSDTKYMGEMLRILWGIQKECEAAELETSLVLLDETLSGLRDPSQWPTTGALRERMLEIVRRVVHELRTKVFVFVPKRLADYYEQPQLFGRAVADGFHDAADDITEAGNCIALNRGTAAVFHLMRALEVAIKAVGASLGIPDPVKESDRNWGKMLGDKDLQVGVWAELNRRNRQNDPAWTPELREFYQGVYTDLCAIRTAWRNPVMHVEGVYLPRTGTPHLQFGEGLHATPCGAREAGVTMVSARTGRDRRTNGLP